MRKGIGFMVLMIIAVFCSCSKSNVGYDVHKKIYDTYQSLPGYEAEAEITSYSNHSENTYSVKQYYKYPGMTRTENTAPESLAGIVTVVNGDTAKVISPSEDHPIQISGISSGDMDYLFVSSFFQLYYKSEETSIRTSTAEGGNVVVLTTETGSSNPYRKNIALTIDSKTLNPVSMEIIGNDMKTYIKVDYTSFRVNGEIDPALFSVEQ